MTTDKSEAALAVPAIVGLDGLIELYGVKRNTIYSQHRRGKFGTPDGVVSGTPLWWADRFSGAEMDRGERPPLPVLLGPVEVAAAFGVQRSTIHVWRVRKLERKKAREDTAETPVDEMPEPALVISYTPIWLPDQWKPFAKATGRPYNPPKPAKAAKAARRRK